MTRLIMSRKSISTDESSGLEWNTRYKIIKGICDGLKYLHERNIIHRDLKPQNILMDTALVPKIADVGLSRLLGEEKSYIVTSNAGTLGYMAPECLRKKGEITKKADIFSLGVIIIEILKGCKDGYPDYHQNTKADFQHFTEKVLSNWRNRFERSPKYTSPELHTQLVKQCIDIALKCVHPDKEKRPNVTNIIEILNAAEESCYDRNGEDLPVDHQMGNQEGVPPSGVLREDDMVVPIKIALKNHAQAWITKVKMTSAVAPLQPQREPVLESVDGSLAFHNLTSLEVLRMRSCESLRKLKMSCLSNAFLFSEADSHVKYQFPVESLAITKWNASGKELTQLLTYFPKLSDLELNELKKVTGLAVNVKGQRATETPGPSSSANINKVKQQQGARAAGRMRSRATESAASEEAERGLLLLPPQLQELRIYDCPELRIPSDRHDDSIEEDGRTGGGGGLQGLTSLRVLRIIRCHKLLSAYSSSSFSSSFTFPNSLEHLGLTEDMGVDRVVLSNLTSLTSLNIDNCWHLRGEGLLSLLAQGHLTKLSVLSTFNFFVDSEHSHSQVHEQEIPSCSSKLQELIICDVAGFSAASIRCNLLFSSLTKLEILDSGVLSFTEEQEALLFVSSLEDITFWKCRRLHSFPERLHRLPNLKSLEIKDCPKIQSVPNDVLPDSLQILRIEKCPAIRSLPEVDDLPSSLRVLDVCGSESEELMNHCRKLINIIPTVEVID